MKFATFTVIVSILLVMVLLTASSAGSDRGSCSNSTLALKFRSVR